MKFNSLLESMSWKGTRAERVSNDVFFDRDREKRDARAEADDAEKEENLDPSVFDLKTGAEIPEAKRWIKEIDDIIKAASWKLLSGRWKKDDKHWDEENEPPRFDEDGSTTIMVGHGPKSYTHPLLVRLNAKEKTLVFLKTKGADEDQKVVDDPKLDAVLKSKGWKKEVVDET